MSPPVALPAAPARNGIIPSSPDDPPTTTTTTTLNPSIQDTFPQDQFANVHSPNDLRQGQDIPSTSPDNAARGLFDANTTLVDQDDVDHGLDQYRNHHGDPASLHSDAPIELDAINDGSRGPLHGDATIEPGGVDDGNNFGTSDYETDSVMDDYSDTTSLSSSILQHEYVNGRRYHYYRQGRYPIPNDEEEQRREQLLHVMMMDSTDGNLFYAPIGPYPQKILDVGTGIGLWAIDVGDNYPSAKVLGYDLSPIMLGWGPPNVEFMVVDVEDEWPNDDNFDLVHLRNMLPILKSPVECLKQAYEHIKPGGWIELQDVDGKVHTDDNTIPDEWPLKSLTHHLVKGFALFDTDVNASELGYQYLQEAGFVNIHHNYIKLPYGAWPQDKLMQKVGKAYQTACEEFLPAVGAIHFPAMGWTDEEIQVFFAQVRLSMRDPNVHAYGKMHFWSGQKPYHG